MASAFQNPHDECDLVMKGGVTSGIVYPPAVLKLAGRYRFRCIGGTSAGAIAAAVTAAAEYGRSSGGFERLQKVSDQLGKGTFLRDLFQPSKETAPLMNTLFAVREGTQGRTGILAGLAGFWRLNLALLRETPLQVFIGAVIGFFISYLFALVVSGTILGKGLILGFFLAWIGGISGGVLRLAKVIVKEIPKNSFGLCKGRKDKPESNGPAVLTDWLSESIQLISGKAAGNGPLTFGDLEKQNIHLKMMTSNLSQNLPYKLPFGSRRFIFKLEEFKGFFPENIVKWLKDNAHQSTRVKPPTGYHFLPDADNLPVAVAMRMSLSFPVLISAVPLYTISPGVFRNGNQRDGRFEVNEEDLQPNLFSDGGISSNFPIHFFDAWLPTRPTFGITLVSLPDDAFTEAGEIKPDDLKYQSAMPVGGEDRGEQKVKDAALPASVFLPKANQPQNPDFKPIFNLFQFLWSIFATAQNFRDNTQSMLPSYRERIAQIRLSENEGGLNLAMSSEVIEKVKAKGALAGEVLLDFRLDHHQWVRFRVLMGLLESNLKDLETVLSNQSFPFDTLIDLQQKMEGEDKFPYSKDQPWSKESRKRIGEIIMLIQGWKTLPHFGEDPPKPQPVLRVVPEV